MSAHRYPHRIRSVHVESIDGELCVYDTARQQVHALNHTAAFVWQRCDGLTAPSELAAALLAQASIDDAEAVVRLTLQELADVQLLEGPIDTVAPVSRRDLLRRGVAAAAIPAIYSIVAPSPAEAQSPPPLVAPTLTSVSPNQGTQGTTVAVTLTGTNFFGGATTVNVGGGGVTVNNVVVGSGTSLTADFVLDLAGAIGFHAVTVTTAGGTSNAQGLIVLPPPPGFELFEFTGDSQTFTVPGGVSSILIEAIGPAGGNAAPVSPGGPFGQGGRGGRAVARVSVVPGTALTVRVGGEGQSGAVGSTAAGGFNGGGATTGDRGGGGGGATTVHDGTTPLVIAGGGGGSGYKASGGGGNGGDGGGLTALSGEINPVGGRWGGGGTQSAGGAGGAAGGSLTATVGTAGVANTGGTGGNNQPGVLGGGGGGGGYFGGGGGGGGTPGSGGGGGGSSFTAPGATNVVHQQGLGTIGSVLISW